MKAEQPASAPARLMPHSTTVHVADGVALGLDRWPAADGAASHPVLFLHAAGMTRGVWRAHCRQLLGDCAPFAVDLRGYGASSRPPRTSGPRSSMTSRRWWSARAGRSW